MKYFERLHPIPCFIYFICVLLISSFAQNPIISCCSFLFAVGFCIALTGAKKTAVSLLYALPLIIIIALINPIFVHKGETYLFFLNDNPVTLEAALYGCYSSVTIAAFFYWCKCFSIIFTSEKFVYLFGKVAPKLSVLLSLVLSFIPRLKRKYKQIDQAQKALGIYATDSFTDKLAAKFRVISVLITAALENSVDTADSMTARGYGLKGRTSFSPYVMAFNDWLVLIGECLLACASLTFIILGAGEFLFYPAISNFAFGVKEVILFVCVAMLFSLCVFVEIKDDIKWRLLKSKI